MAGNTTQSVLEQRRPQVPELLAPFLTGAAGAGTGALGQIQGFTGATLPTAREGLLATARGDFLAGGPGFDAAVNAAMNAAQPRILSTFGRAGRGTGGLAEVALGQAAADAVASQFSSERARQQAAQLVPLELERGLASGAASLTPSLVGSDATRTQEFRGDNLTGILGGALTGASILDLLLGGGSGGLGLGGALGAGANALGLTAAVKNLFGLGGGESPADDFGVNPLIGSGDDFGDNPLGAGANALGAAAAAKTLLGGGAVGAAEAGALAGHEALQTAAPALADLGLGSGLLAPGSIGAAGPPAAGAPFVPELVFPGAEFGVPAESLLLGGEGAGGLGLPQVPGAAATAGLPASAEAAGGFIGAGEAGLSFLPAAGGGLPLAASALPFFPFLINAFRDTSATAAEKGAANFNTSLGRALGGGPLPTQQGGVQEAWNAEVLRLSLPEYGKLTSDWASLDPPLVESTFWEAVARQPLDAQMRILEGASWWAGASPIPAMGTE